MFFSASALANSGSSQTRMLSKMDPALTCVHTPSDKSCAACSVRCVPHARASTEREQRQEKTVLETGCVTRRSLSRPRTRGVQACADNWLHTL